MAARALRPKDALVQDLVRLATQKDLRGAKRRCVVIGSKLVTDLGKRHHFRELLFPRSYDQALLEGMRAETRYVAEEKSLRQIAQLKSYDGLLCTMDLPKATEDFGDVRLMLCLEHVRDPGVLGTLLRTALALQWQAVYFLPGCADPFDPLCMRASQGALFDLPFGRGNHANLQQLCRLSGLRLCVSNARGTDIRSESFTAPPRGVALLLREEYSAPSAPPRDALKIRVPDLPLRGQLPVPPAVASAALAGIDSGAAHAAELDQYVADTFDPRSLDVAVAGGILMYNLRTFHYPFVSRSPALASPAAPRRAVPAGVRL